MRKLVLADCEIAVISLPDDGARRAAVAGALDSVGLRYRMVDGLRCSPGAVGCGLSHLRVLRAWDGSHPLLVLEDDIALTPDYLGEIDVPADADAVYLGASSYGAIDAYDFTGFTNAVLAEPISPAIVRIHNMMASHAILHLTERWCVAAIEAILHAVIDRGWAPDSGLAKIQGDFRVYAPRKPLFYQSASLQSPAASERQETSTLVEIPTHPIGAVLRVGIGDGWAPLRIVREGERLTWAPVR